MKACQYTIFLLKEELCIFVRKKKKKRIFFSFFNTFFYFIRFFLEFEVEFPEELTDDQKKLIDQAFPKQ